MKNNIQLTAAHIPGKQNIIADRESRVSHVDSKWMLSPRYLHQSLNLLSFKPDIDLFATQINRQFSDYVAYRPDPEATFMDAFTIDWPGLKFYALPPIAIISRVLSKISQDETKGIIVVPYWPNQVWYPVMLKMLISIPILLNAWKSLLQLPQSPDQNHPIWRKMDMTVAHLSGSSSSTLSKAAIEIISASWRQGTEQRYNGHIKRFGDFCYKRQADPLCATNETSIELLTEYFNTGMQGLHYLPL